MNDYEEELIEELKKTWTQCQFEICQNRATDLLYMPSHDLHLKVCKECKQKEWNEGSLSIDVHTKRIDFIPTFKKPKS